MLTLALPLALALCPAPTLGGSTYEAANCMVPTAARASADRLAELLPADAFFVLRARSIQKVLDDVNLLMGQGPESPERVTVADLLEPLDSDAVAAKIDVSRPVGLAMTFSEGQPMMTAALPVLDAAAVIAAMPGGPDAGLRAVAAGDYVVVSTLPVLQLPSAPSALIAGLPAHDIVVHLDVVRLMEKFRPMIDMGLEQAETALDSSEAQPGQPDPAAAAEPYFDLARSFMDSAETLQISLDELTGRMHFAGRFTVREGSPMSKWYTGERRDLARLAPLVDSQAALVTMSNCDPTVQARRGLEWMESMGDALPENVRGLIDLEQRVWRQMLPKTGGMTAMSLDLSVDGLKGLTYVEAKEPQALFASVQEFLAAPELAKFGMQLAGPTVRELDGTAWSEYRMLFDVESFARAFDPDVQIPAADKADAEHAIAAFMGDGGLRLGLASSNGFLVMRMNGDDGYARRAIARLGAAATVSLGTGLDNALAEARLAQAAYVGQIDIGRVLNQVADLAASLGHKPEIPVALLGSSFPVTFHGAVDGVAWRGGIEVDSVDIARFVKAVQQAEGAPATPRDEDGDMDDDEER